jgi:hypothetical protein
LVAWDGRFNVVIPLKERKYGVNNNQKRNYELTLWGRMILTKE